MTTKQTETQPEIIWERGEYLTTEDHTSYYAAKGESADGRKWEGGWECTCDEVEITNIAEA